MCHVNRVIDRKPHREDQESSSNNIDFEAREVHQPNDLNEGKDDTQRNQTACDEAWNLDVKKQMQQYNQAEDWFDISQRNFSKHMHKQTPLHY